MNYSWAAPFLKIDIFLVILYNSAVLCTLSVGSVNVALLSWTDMTKIQKSIWKKGPYFQLQAQLKSHGTVRPLIPVPLCQEHRLNIMMDNPLPPTIQKCTSLLYQRNIHHYTHRGRPIHSFQSRLFSVHEWHWIPAFSDSDSLYRSHLIPFS